MQHIVSQFYRVDSNKDLQRAAQHAAKTTKPVSIFHCVTPEAFPVIVVLHYQKKYNNVNVTAALDESEIALLSLAFLERGEP